MTPYKIADHVTIKSILQQIILEGKRCKVIGKSMGNLVLRSAIISLGALNQINDGFSGYTLNNSRGPTGPCEL